MADLTGRIVVNLRGDVQIPYQDAVQTQLPQDAADAWNGRLDEAESGFTKRDRPEVAVDRGSNSVMAAPVP